MCRLKGIVMAYKRSFAIALAVGLLSGLWGCGEAGKAPARKAGLESVDPSGQKVTFWYQHSEERETALRALIDKFNSTNEYGIKVIGEHAGGHDEIYQKMLGRMQSGAPPQLVVAYRYQAQHYYQSGGVVDLMPYIYSPAWGLSAEERGDYFQEFIDQDRIKGVQVAFLPSRSMEVLYYNADWLAELGYDAPGHLGGVCRDLQEGGEKTVQQSGRKREEPGSGDQRRRQPPGRHGLQPQRRFHQLRRQRLYPRHTADEHFAVDAPRTDG